MLSIVSLLIVPAQRLGIGTTQAIGERSAQFTPRVSNTGFVTPLQFPGYFMRL